MATENIIDGATGLVTLAKRPSEARIYDMDCTKYLRVGDAISTLDNLVITNLGKVSGSSDVTKSLQSHNGAQRVQAKYSGGTHAEDYEIQATITTVLGDVLFPKVLLRVRD